MENATSHSSLNSSYGEDSGIYQTSPASKGFFFKKFCEKFRIVLIRFKNKFFTNLLNLSDKKWR